LPLFIFKKKFPSLYFQKFPQINTDPYIFSTLFLDHYERLLMELKSIPTLDFHGELIDAYNRERAVAFLPSEEPSKEPSNKARHAVKSLYQLANYMASDRVEYGILTSYKRSWAVVQDDYGCFHISPEISLKNILASVYVLVNLACGTKMFSKRFDKRAADLAKEREGEKAKREREKAKEAKEKSSDQSSLLQKNKDL